MKKIVIPRTPTTGEVVQEASSKMRAIGCGAKIPDAADATRVAERRVASYCYMEKKHKKLREQCPIIIATSGRSSCCAAAIKLYTGDTSICTECEYMCGGMRNMMMYAEEGLL